jgi:hypothetical protein
MLRGSLVRHRVEVARAFTSLNRDKHVYGLCLSLSKVSQLSIQCLSITFSSTQDTPAFVLNHLLLSIPTLNRIPKQRTPIPHFGEIPLSMFLRDSVFATILLHVSRPFLINKREDEHHRRGGNERGPQKAEGDAVTETEGWLVLGAVDIGADEVAGVAQSWMVESVSGGCFWGEGRGLMD